MLFPKVDGRMSKQVNRKKKLNINANPSGFLEMAEYFNRIKDNRSLTQREQENKDQKTR
jgi:hypothetical protein